MNLTLAGVFADAGALLRRDRDLLFRIAGVFFFLPVLAASLFLVLPARTPDATQEQAMAALLAWYAGNAHWVLGNLVVQTMGSTTLLVLLLDPGRPTLGEALARALRLLPWMVAAWLLVLLLVSFGLTLFIVPGLYAIGRTFLTAAILVAEPDRGPFAAVVASVQRTRNRGWLLLAVTAAVFAVTYLIAAVVGEASAQLAGVPVQTALDALTAAVSSLASLVQVLLQIAAYRRLAPSRRGI